ncbi:MAG: Dyp-type peroxidase [Actinobacteria bacterium]|nr:Dyp-type peroxidase [Actinomycetota bacterium]
MSTRFGRRRFLAGAGVIAGATVVGGNAAATTPEVPQGAPTIPFFGDHQSGIAETPQAQVTVVAFDLLSGIKAADVQRLLRIWTDDAQRLTQGRPALADTEVELALIPARLSVTIGFGPKIPALVGGREKPDWLAPLPDFRIDRLMDRWSHGDLVLQVASDDPTTVAHAVRMMQKDSQSFARVRWSQRGFLRAPGSQEPGSTPRNLMGQLDGTVNPGGEEMDQVVWINEGPKWLHNGTGMVVRRIRMNLDGWDTLSRLEKEAVMGRRLDSGAPLSGTQEYDTPDFEARDETGLTVIPEFSHVRLSHGDGTQRIRRRGYNYDDGFVRGKADLGLIFIAFCRDVNEQFVPMQRRLARQDVLNTWTTPIGSAVFAVPPGCAEGGYIGETLFG